MSKELRIGVPGAGQASDVPAFSVSRDSAGILFAVRDNAAPQFAVSRDSQGLLLSSWPVTPPAPPVPASFRSYSTSIDSTANPHTVSKPAGLAVGDLMVLAALSWSGSASSGPAGFTQILQSVGTPCLVTVWTKVAQSADVAASNFAVGNTALAHLGLALYAVRGAVEYSAIIRRTEDAWLTGFTPAAAGDVFIVFLSVDGGYSDADCELANNNPVWPNDFRDWTWGMYDSSHASYVSGATGIITSPRMGESTSGAFAFVAIGSS